MPPKPQPAGDAEDWWGVWRKRLDQAEDPSEFLQDFPDSALVQLLGEVGDDQATERNLLLAETLRRVAGRPSQRSAHAAHTLDQDIHRASADVDEAAQSVHETEAAVEAKASPEHRGGSQEPAQISHKASREVEALRDLAHKVERKADYLMRLHRTGEFVTPGRVGEEAEAREDFNHE